MRYAAVVLLCGAAVLSAVLTPLMKRLARRLGLLDHPGPRKAQQEPVPYLGGAAIFLSFFVVQGAALWGLLSAPGQKLIDELGLSLLLREVPLVRERLPALVLLFAGGTLCAAVGLLDDKLGPRLPVAVKLCGQFLAAFLAVAAGAQTTALWHPWLNLAVSVIWIVAVTNAVNFVDNMDGLASGLVIISGSILWAVAFQQDQFFMEVILLVLVGAAAGFLPFNFSPASIYLGDTGSLFLGYMLGALTLLESYVKETSGSFMPVVLPLIVLTVPVFDMISVIVIRVRENRPIYVGDRSHLSHRLVALGMQPRTAVLFLYLIALGLGLAAAMLPDLDRLNSFLVLGQWGLSLVMISVLMVVGRRGRAEK